MRERGREGKGKGDGGGGVDREREGGICSSTGPSIACFSGVKDLCLSQGHRNN